MVDCPYCHQDKPLLADVCPHCTQYVGVNSQIEFTFWNKVTETIFWSIMLVIFANIASCVNEDLSPEYKALSPSEQATYQIEKMRSNN